DGFNEANRAFGRFARHARWRLHRRRHGSVPSWCGGGKSRSIQRMTPHGRLQHCLCRVARPPPEGWPGHPTAVSPTERLAPLTGCTRRIGGAESRPLAHLRTEPRQLFLLQKVEDFDDLLRINSVRGSVPLVEPIAFDHVRDEQAVMQLLAVREIFER